MLCKQLLLSRSLLICSTSGVPTYEYSDVSPMRWGKVAVAALSVITWQNRLYLALRNPPFTIVTFSLFADFRYFLSQLSFGAKIPIFLTSGNGPVKLCGA